MNDLLLLDAIERYHSGTMSADEKAQFDALRKSNPEIDQLVVEQSFFLHEIDKYSELKNYKQTLHNTHIKLTEDGTIVPAKLQGKSKVVFLWQKYKRVAAVAASIAGIVSILTAGLTSAYNNKTNPAIAKLSRELETIKKGQNETASKLNAVEGKIDPKATPKSGGTGFLIDAKGYLITNAHVLKGKTIVATNEKGEQFLTTVCMQDKARDIAILKITDTDFVPYKSLPYSINKTVNLAEPIYTMGYPKDEIVYGEGYLSSETGYKSDTLTYQISIAADHGNSGGPVLNKNGDVIGILTDKLEGGSVFAVKSLYIFKTVENLKKDSSFSNIKLANTNSIKNLQRVQQVKKVNNCVFLIKSYE